MYKMIADAQLEQVRKRVSEGDCPVTEALSVESLEHLVLHFALYAADSMGQADGWSALSAAEIVRRTRCEADAYRNDLARAAAWRNCCDAILDKLANPSSGEAQTQKGGR